MYLSLIKERKMGVKGTWEDSSALRIECPSILGEKTKKREREGEKGRQMMMESGLDLFKWPHMYARGKLLQLLGTPNTLWHETIMDVGTLTTFYILFLLYFLNRWFASQHQIIPLLLLSLLLSLLPSTCFGLYLVNP